MKRLGDIQTIAGRVAQQTFGRTLSEAQATGICVECGKPAPNFRDPLSLREYTITGQCQACQDGMPREE